MKLSSSIQLALVVAGVLFASGPSDAAPLASGGAVTVKSHWVNPYRPDVDDSVWTFTKQTVTVNDTTKDFGYSPVASVCTTRVSAIKSVVWYVEQDRSVLTVETADNAVTCRVPGQAKPVKQSSLGSQINNDDILANLHALLDRRHVRFIAGP